MQLAVESWQTTQKCGVLLGPGAGAAGAGAGLVPAATFTPGAVGAAAGTRAVVVGGAMGGCTPLCLVGWRVAAGAGAGAGGYWYEGTLGSAPPVKGADEEEEEVEEEDDDEDEEG